MYLVVASVVIICGFEGGIKARFDWGLLGLGTESVSMFLFVFFSSTFAVLLRLKDINVWLKSWMDLALLVRSMGKKWHQVAASVTKGLSFGIEIDGFGS